MAKITSSRARMPNVLQMSPQLLPTRRPDHSANADAPRGLSREFPVHLCLCPNERRENGRIVVAVPPNAKLDALDSVEMVYGAEVVQETTSADDLARMIERLATMSEHSLELLDRSTRAHSATDVTADVRDLAAQPPVVRYVNLLIRDAYDAGASDVHLESTSRELSARFRMDGIPSQAPPAGKNRVGRRVSEYSSQPGDRLSLEL